MAFEFFQEVRIAPRPHADHELKELHGRIGAVLGISREPGQPPASYAIAIDGLDEVWSLHPDDLVATGKLRSRSDYYGGVSMRVGVDGEPRD
jgi:hypothetical protein